MDSKKQQHPRYSHLLAGLLLLPLAAFGQDATDDEPIEEIVVTGSHIQGVSEEVLAVTVMGENEIRDLGAASMFDLLGYIPAISDFEFEDNSNGTNAVRGDVAGVNMRSLGTGNTLVLANVGASFSIPTHQVSAFLTALIEGGKDARAGGLGVDVETALDEDGNPEGARVVRVRDWSPAGPRSKRGLKRGDVIQVIWGFGEDHRINTASDITNLLSLCRVGTFLKIKYKRGKRFYEWSGRLPARSRGRR